MNAHEIDFHIYGEEMQYVEIELDPQEGVIAEAGSFMDIWYLSEKVSAEVRPYLVTYPDNMEKMIWNNYKWWVEHKAEAEERWSAWMLK